MDLARGHRCQRLRRAHLLPAWALCRLTGISRRPCWSDTPTAPHCLTVDISQWHNTHTQRGHTHTHTHTLCASRDDKPVTEMIHYWALNSSAAELTTRQKSREDRRETEASPAALCAPVCVRCSPSTRESRATIHPDKARQVVTVCVCQAVYPYVCSVSVCLSVGVCVCVLYKEREK